MNSSKEANRDVKRQPLPAILPKDGESDVLFPKALATHDS